MHFNIPGLPAKAENLGHSGLGQAALKNKPMTGPSNPRKLTKAFQST